VKRSTDRTVVQRFPGIRRRLVLAERAHRVADDDPATADERRLAELSSVLSAALAIDPRVDFRKLKVKPELPVFDPRGLDRGAVAPEPPTPELVAGMARFVPLLGRARSARDAAAQRAYLDARAAWESGERERREGYSELVAAHRDAYRRATAEAARVNSEVDAFRADYVRHRRAAVVEYFSLVLNDDVLPEGLPEAFAVDYRPAARELLVERELPGIDLIPPLRRRSELEQRYAKLVADVVLRTLRNLCEADSADALASVALDGYVRDPDNGLRWTRVSLCARKETVLAIPFARVDAARCLRELMLPVAAPPRSGKRRAAPRDLARTP
jgi:restriction system protein